MARSPRPSAMAPAFVIRKAKSLAFRPLCGPFLTPASVLPSTGAPANSVQRSALRRDAHGQHCARFEGRTWGLITQWRTVTPPARHRRFPSIPGAHRVPMEAHEKNKRGTEGGDKDFSDSNEFKGLAKKTGNRSTPVGVRASSRYPQTLGNKEIVPYVMTGKSPIIRRTLRC